MKKRDPLKGVDIIEINPKNPLLATCIDTIVTVLTTIQLSTFSLFNWFFLRDPDYQQCKHTHFWAGYTIHKILQFLFWEFEYVPVFIYFINQIGIPACIRGQGRVENWDHNVIKIDDPIFHQHCSSSMLKDAQWNHFSGKGFSCSSSSPCRLLLGMVRI